MKFVREKAKAIEPVSEKQLLRGLSYMKGVSDCRIALLEAEDGSYVQAGGSGMTCALEGHDETSGRHFRAFQHPPVVPWPGITRLNISGGSVSLRQEEFMRLEKIKEAFLAFFHRQPFPSYLQWRDITEEVAAIIFNTTPNT